MARARRVYLYGQEDLNKRGLYRDSVSPEYQVAQIILVSNTDYEWIQ